MIGCGTCYRCLDGRQHVCARPLRGRHPQRLARGLGGTAADAGHRAARAAGRRRRHGRRTRRARRQLVARSTRGRPDRGPAGCSSWVPARSACWHCSLRSPPARRSTSPASTRLPGPPLALGAHGVWTTDALPTLPWDAVIDATNGASVPALALDLVEPAGRVVYIGLSTEPSLIDTRTAALKDVTAVGVLSASPGTGRHNRRVRGGHCRSSTAGRRHGRARPGSRRAGRVAPGRRRTRTQDPH